MAKIRLTKLQCIVNDEVDEDEVFRFEQIQNKYNY